MNEHEATREGPSLLEQALLARAVDGGDIDPEERRKILHQIAASPTMTVHDALEEHGIPTIRIAEIEQTVSEPLVPGYQILDKLG